MILIDIIAYYARKTIRTIYCFYRLFKIDFGQGKQLQFPLIIEGKGKILFGKSARLQKHVRIGVGAGGKLKIGIKSLIEMNSTILIKAGCNLLIGNNFKLGNHSKLYVNQDFQFGDGVKIGKYCDIFPRESAAKGHLRIDNSSHIGGFTIIDLVDDVTIGKNVALGPHCTLYTHDHIYDDPELPSWKGGLISKPIIIGDGAWIGSGVTILPGVTIGERAVVAAGSVVTKDVQDFGLYGGIPAKFIKSVR